MLQKLTETVGLRTRGILILIAAGLLWVGVIIGSGAGWNPLGIDWRFSNPGAFGDSFGPLGTMMAAIAAIGAIAAYRAQVRETNRAKAREGEQDDITMSDRQRFIRREIEADKRVEKTTFESTFFKLLDSFRAIVSAVDIRTRRGDVVSAHDAYQIILSRMDTLDSVRASRGDAWKEVAAQYSNDLNHYFRFLYHVILYVDCSNIDNKYFYVRLVRAMLSEAELVLLALNCEYGDGREKFKALVEKYSLLHNVSIDARKRWGLNDAFSEDAFGRPSENP